MAKLIAIDMDGTLLNDYKELTTENKQALEKANESGIEIVIATGRNYTAALPFVKKLKTGTIEFLICSNGATIYNLKTSEIIYNNLLNEDQIKDLLSLNAYLKDSNIHFLDEEMIYTHQNPVPKHTISDAYLSFLNIRVIEKKELEKLRNLNKGLLTSETHDVDLVMARIPSKYFEKYNIVKSGTNYIELLNKHVDKGHALKRIIDILEMDSSQVIAIGDQENDIGMFKVSGTSYAMANSLDHIKVEADFVAPSNNENGVAKIIKKSIERG